MALRSVFSRSKWTRDRPELVDARIYHYYARWTGTNWQKRFIAQARPIYNGQPDYGGGIALDPQN